MSTYSRRLVPQLATLTAVGKRFRDHCSCLVSRGTLPDGVSDGDGRGPLLSPQAVHQDPVPLGAEVCNYRSSVRQCEREVRVRVGLITVEKSYLDVVPGLYVAARHVGCALAA